MKRSFTGVLWPFAGLILLLCSSLPAADHSYHLLKKVPLGAAQGGGEYFDYITFDPSSGNVFLSHGTEVKVVSADGSNVVGTIAGLKRDHGVAIVPELN